MDELEILLAEEVATLKKLANIKILIREYWLKKHKEDYGIEAGVAVVLNDGRQAVVTSVEGTNSYGKPWIKGRVKKKNGDLGKLVKDLCGDWEIINETNHSEQE